MTVTTDGELKAKKKKKALTNLDENRDLKLKKKKDKLRRQEIENQKNDIILNSTAIFHDTNEDDEVKNNLKLQILL